MLIKSKQPSVMDMLDKAVYLEQHEVISPSTIPLVENSRLNGYVVRLDDLNRLSEEMEVTNLLSTIAEVNGIDESSIRVCVDESDLIVNPNLSVPNMVIAPVLESDMVYQYVSECVNQFMGDDQKLYESLIEDSYLTEFADSIKNFYTQDFKDAHSNYKKAKDTYKYIDDNWKQENNTMKGFKKTIDSETASEAEKKQAQTDLDNALLNRQRNTKTLRDQEWDTVKSGAKGVGKVALTAAGIAGAVKGAQALVQMAQSRPKSWIGKKISALRNIYHKFMDKAQNVANKSQSAPIKSAAAKILAVIDKLLLVMQKHAG